jgi:hypothetical protein
LGFPANRVNTRKLPFFAGGWEEKALLEQGFFGEIPYSWNRELKTPNREFDLLNRQSAQGDQMIRGE